PDARRGRTADATIRIAPGRGIPLRFRPVEDAERGAVECAAAARDSPHTFRRAPTISEQGSLMTRRAQRRSRSAIAVGTFGSLLGAILSGVTFAEQTPALNVPEGFTVSLYADDDLVHDVHAMTIDSLGRVVVSGPRYVRILVDENGD